MTCYSQDCPQTVFKKDTYCSECQNKYYGPKDKSTTIEIMQAHFRQLAKSAPLKITPPSPHTPGSIAERIYNVADKLF